MTTKNVFKLSEVYIGEGERLLCIHSPHGSIRAGQVYEYGVLIHEDTPGLFKKENTYDQQLRA